MTIIQTLREIIARAMFRRRLRRAIDEHARNCPTGRAFYAALETARAENAAWKREQRRANARRRWGLAVAVAAILIAGFVAGSAVAFAHYQPDPCHPQASHEETCTHDQGHHSQEDAGR